MNRRTERPPQPVQPKESQPPEIQEDSSSRQILADENPAQPSEVAHSDPPPSSDDSSESGSDNTGDD